MSPRPGSLLGPGADPSRGLGAALGLLAAVVLVLAGLVATGVVPVGAADHVRVTAAATEPVDATVTVPATAAPAAEPTTTAEPTATGAVPVAPRTGSAPQGSLVAGPQPLPGAASAPPASVEVPAIGVSAPVDRIDRDAATNELVPPDTTDTVGWFQGGPVPGDLGPAVIAGHVDSRAGPAVFFGLRELLPGDAVTVVRTDGTRESFRVSRVEQFSKGAFPTRAVYGPTPGAELRLITCGGTFDPGARSYRDNVIVYAQRA